MKNFLLLFTGIAASVISLKYFPAPYIWISLSFFVLFIYSSITGKKTTVKLLLLIIGIMIFIIGCVEAYLWTSHVFRDKERFVGDYADHEKGYTLRDDVLGYAPGKGKSFMAVKFQGEKELYNVTYTIDRKGEGRRHFICKINK